MVGAINAMVGSGLGVIINITDRTVSRGAAGSATATYQINSDGFAKNQAGNNLEQWCSAPSLTGNYEVRATLSGGTSPTSGTLNSWLSCSTSPSWTNTNGGSSGSTITSTLLIEIRPNAGAAVDSATVTVSATVL